MTKAELTTNRKMIKKVTLDFYGGDGLLMIGYQYRKESHPFEIQRVSARETTGVFKENLSLN